MVKRKESAEKQDDRMTVELSQDEAEMLIDETQMEKEISPTQDAVVCGTRSKSHITPLKHSSAVSSIDECEETTNKPKEEGSCELKSLRTSARVSKRIKKEITSRAAVEPQHAIKKAVGKQNPQPEQLRTRRSWELWSVEDKNNFFEALCEYGKDFENIQSFIAQRSRKKGILPNMIKNKDQVRHFYYRTWHKISKYLDIGDDVKKQTQELYGLINYAELRKKIGGCLNEKNRQKLNELVFQGVTTVKFRGKKLRIKTPICRALKKLNCVEEAKEPESPKLPKEIYVEFRPRTNATWLHVQNLAQNPRLRTKVNLQIRLSTIITYLEKRWKPLRLQQKEQIASNMPSPSTEQSTMPDNAPVLRLRPQCDSAVSLLSVSSVDNASFANVCLEKHVKNLHTDQKDKEQCKNKKVSRTKCKTKCTAIDCDEHSEAMEKSSFENDTKNSEQNADEVCQFSESAEKLCSSDSGKKCEEQIHNPEEEEARRSLSLLKNILQSIDTENDGDECKTDCAAEDNKNLVEEEEGRKTDKAESCGSMDLYLSTQTENANMTLGQILSLASETDDKEVEEGHCSSETTKAEKSDEIKPVNEEQQRILKGWTLEDIGLLTVGELYLMLKCPEKLVLEYEFESRPRHLNGEDTNLAGKESYLNLQIEDLGRVLKKLVTVASNYFSDFKNKQNPLSPTNRGSSQHRVTTTAPTKCSAGRAIGRNPGIRNVSRSHLENKSLESSTSDPVTISGSLVPDVDALSQPSAELQTSTAKETSDKHVFVVPVRAAPRNVKSRSNKDNVRDGIELIPGRRSRQKRKPLVVKRTLLPRSNDLNSSTIGSMTVVHLLPSASPLTTVIPSTSSHNPMQKMLLPPAKKIMKVLPTVSTSPVDVRSLQIPLLKPVTTGNTIVLPPNTLPTAHVMERDPGLVNSVQPLNTSLVSLERTNDSVISIASNTVTQSAAHLPVRTSCAPALLTASSSIATKASAIATICITTLNSSSPPRISIPENTSTNLSPNISSLLEMSLPEAIRAETIPGSNAEHLLDFNENSNSSLSAAFGLTPTKEQIRSRSKCLSVDPMVSQRQVTPPQSPGSRFKVNSPGPEAQWLNGEGADFSLNSLLNTFESPCKNSVHSSGDASSLDSISRLAPDVDTHLQCLINENSVDYVAKFADLAAQIASTSTESKCS